MARFEWIDQKLYHRALEDRIREPIPILKRMIAEDDAHARLPLAPLDKMAVEDRVRELIFRLRDQNGIPQSERFHLGSIDSPAATVSPMDDLLAIGPAAVPQLIEAVDDSRFTRWVSFGSRHSPEVEVFPIGHCAYFLIGTIGGWESLPEEARKTDSPEAAVIAKQTLREWWAKLQSKGKQ